MYYMGDDYDDNVNHFDLYSDCVMEIPIFSCHIFQTQVYVCSLAVM